MALRFYLVPAVECVRGGQPLAGSRCPKYFAATAGVRWGAMDYGSDPLFLVLADVTAAQHTQLSAQPDVTHIVQYANLDNQVGGAVTAVQTGLENLNIPGQWVQSTTTWRTVLRIVAACFQLQQRVHGLSGRSVFREGVDLSRTWASLPAGIRQDVQAAADTFGWDYSALSGASTLREVLRHLGQQWGSAPFQMGGISF